MSDGTATGAACGRPDLNERLVDLLDDRAGAGMPSAPPSSASSSLRSELRAHAESCARCHQELAALSLGFGALASAELEPPTEEALDRARQAVFAEAWNDGRAESVVPSASTAAVQSVSVALRLSTGRVFTASAVGLGIALIEAVGLGVRIGLLGSAMSIAAVALLVAAWVLGLAAAGGAPRLVAAFIGTGVLGVAMAAASLPGQQLGPTACFALVNLCAFVPLVAGGLILGEALPRRAVSGAIGGAAAGLLGVAVLRSHCPAGGLVHGFVVHGLAVPVAAALGAAFIQLRPRNALDTPRTIQ